MVLALVGYYSSSSLAPVQTGLRFIRQQLCRCYTVKLFSFSSAIKYDAAKEERYQQEAKQRELQRIDEALQLAARRGETGRPLALDLRLTPD